MRVPGGSAASVEGASSFSREGPGFGQACGGGAPEPERVADGVASRPRPYPLGDPVVFENSHDNPAWFRPSPPRRAATSSASGFPPPGAGSPIEFAYIGTRFLSGMNVARAARVARAVASRTSRLGSEVTSTSGVSTAVVGLQARSEVRAESRLEPASPCGFPASFPRSKMGLWEDPPLKGVVRVGTPPLGLRGGGSDPATTAILRGSSPPPLTPLRRAASRRIIKIYLFCERAPASPARRGRGAVCWLRVDCRCPPLPGRSRRSRGGLSLSLATPTWPTPPSAVARAPASRPAGHLAILVAPNACQRTVMPRDKLLPGLSPALAAGASLAPGRRAARNRPDRPPPRRPMASSLPRAFGAGPDCPANHPTIGRCSLVAPRPRLPPPTPTLAHRPLC